MCYLRPIPCCHPEAQQPVADHCSISGLQKLRLSSLVSRQLDSILQTQITHVGFKCDISTYLLSVCHVLSSHSLSFSGCLSLTLSVSVSPSHAHIITLSLCLPVCLSPGTLPLSTTHYVSFSFAYLCLSPYFLSHSVYISLPPYFLFLTIPSLYSISLSSFPSHALSLPSSSFSLFLSVSTSLSVCLSHS